MTMAAYLVIDTNWNTTPAETRQAFGRKAQPAIRQHGGRFLTAVDNEVLEGDWMPPILTIVEFPDAEHARQYWHSPEFQEAVAIRRETDAEFKVVLVNGVGTGSEEIPTLTPGA